MKSESATASHHPKHEPARRRMYPASELRMARLTRGLRLVEVAMKARLSVTRVSYVERDPSLGTEEELQAIRSAIEALARELQPLGGAA